MIVVGSQQWQNFIACRRRARLRARAGVAVLIVLCTALGFYLGTW